MNPNSATKTMSATQLMSCTAAPVDFRSLLL
jgi:hypothetical protein